MNDSVFCWRLMFVSVNANVASIGSSENAKKPTIRAR
jgi:hypothetical protein